MSVCSSLKNIEDKKQFFASTISEPDFKSNIIDKAMELCNDYPKWVSRYKEWGFFGIFTSNVINKILDNNFPNKIRYFNVIGSNLLMSHGSDSELRVLQIYRNPSFNWKQCLYETYKLTKFYSMYRSRDIITLRADETEIRETRNFFELTEALICKEFKNKKSIYINPTLGNKLIGADANIIADDCIYDITATRYPANVMLDAYYKMMMYAGLIDFNKSQLSTMKKIKREYPKYLHNKINNVAMIFPLFLDVQSVNIKKWKKEKRLKAIISLIEQTPSRYKITGKLTDALFEDDFEEMLGLGVFDDSLIWGNDF